MLPQAPPQGSRRPLSSKTVFTAFKSKFQNILAGITAAFFCGRTFLAPNTPGIQFKDGTIVNIVPAASVASSEAWLRVLLEKLSPAPFGHGSETKFDPNVRNALQLKASDGAFTVLNFDINTSGILDTIKEKLFAHTPSVDVKAELYALNAYCKGGHFKSHKDTPRGEGMLGTLLVSLPSRYIGGELVLKHRGLSFSPLKQDLPLEKSPTMLSWAAFFSDVDHCVLPVKEGVRLTLSYILRRKDSIDNSVPPPPSQSEALRDLLKRVLADQHFLPEGGVLAFPCRFMYSKEDLFGNLPKGESLEASDTPLTLALTNKLKGHDALVASSVLQVPGIEVFVQPYLVESCADERWRLPDFPAANAAKKLGKRVDSSKLEKVFPGVAVITDWKGESGEELWLEDPPTFNSYPVKKKKPRIVGPQVDEKQAAAANEGPVVAHLHSCSYSEDGYFGNEASDTDIYLYLALCIHVPAFDDEDRRGSSLDHPAVPAAAAASTI